VGNMWPVFCMVRRVDMQVINKVRRLHLPTVSMLANGILWLFSP
jgi:hypothetical protein